MRTQEGVRAEARTMELRAVAQLGRAAARSPTPPCRRPAAAPAAPAAPCAPPYGRSNSAVAPQSRRRASDIALWRRACASPTLSMRALPARTPCGRHRNPSSEPAGGSLLPPPPPSSAGAAAPSSLVLPICTEKNSVSKSPPQGDFFFGLRRAIFLYGEDLTGVPDLAPCLLPRVPRPHPAGTEGTCSLWPGCACHPSRCLGQVSRR